MKTYKNPALRASSVVKAEDKPAAASGSKPSGATGAQVKKNPVCELVNDKKWTIVRTIPHPLPHLIMCN